MRFPTQPPRRNDGDDQLPDDYPGENSGASFGDFRPDGDGPAADDDDDERHEPAAVTADTKALAGYRASFGGHSRAFRLFARAFHAQMHGDLPTALKLYRASIDLHPTAEAWTFLGWTFSFAKRLDEAITCCLRAIRIDPGFGNPYNDIGAYLMAQGKEEEALPWFGQAVTAPRYEARQYAHCNAGIALERTGRLEESRRQFRAAISLAPDYALAIAHKRRLDGLFN
jgi:tetratricopeptide (TPR) repeat protein